MKTYFFEVDFKTHALRKITSSIYPSTTKSRKVSYHGGSVRGLMYTTNADNEREAFIQFHNHITQ